jgi:polysaccharide export outer membrane protein
VQGQIRAAEAAPTPAEAGTSPDVIAQAPAQEGEPAAPSGYGYTIQPEDVLQITVYEEPDLTTRARVTSRGEVTFPLLGNVPVAGLMLEQVQDKLTRLLETDYLVNPQVQVFIESYRPLNVFVTGSVSRPGSYPIPTERPTTVMEAVAMAGGFSEEAAINKTRIIRIENGLEKTIEVRVNDIITRGDKAKDVVVYANDIIFVPESFF